MRISDWNSDVCSSDLGIDLADLRQRHALLVGLLLVDRRALRIDLFYLRGDGGIARLSESIIALADLAGGAQPVERLRCGGAGQQRPPPGRRGPTGGKGEQGP